VKILLDANLPTSLAAFLKKKYGIRCKRIRLAGQSDDDIYRSAKKGQWTLFSLDTDFLNILRYPPGKHSGIVVFRLRNQRRTAVIATVLNFCETFKGQWDRLRGSTVVVREDRFRIHYALKS